MKNLLFLKFVLVMNKLTVIVFFIRIVKCLRLGNSIKIVYEVLALKAGGSEVWFQNHN